MLNFLYDLFHAEPHETIAGIVVSGIIAAFVLTALTPLQGDFAISVHYTDPTPVPALAEVLARQDTALAFEPSPVIVPAAPIIAPSEPQNYPSTNLLGSIFSLIANFFK